jgi:putative SOS response-associated peptidase YedK
VLGSAQGHEARLMRWGLVPPWATDLSFGNRCINARSEEAASKPAFRAAMKSRRCLVPISGFYEWQKIGDKLKQPWYFTPADGTLFALAGLWESWGPSETRTETFTLLTGPPNALLAKIHDRMPCIMPADLWDRWLDNTQPPPPLPIFHAEEMLGTTVSTRVNSPRNDTPDLIQPVASEGLW